MNDDDLHGPKLSPPPPTAPMVRGAAIALVTVALATSLGCNPSNPGVPAYDTGITVPNDSAMPDAGNPGLVADAGITIPPDTGTEDAALNPGLPAPDAGTDASNP